MSRLVIVSCPHCDAPGSNCQTCEGEGAIEVCETCSEQGCVCPTDDDVSAPADLLMWLLVEAKRLAPDGARVHVAREIDTNGSETYRVCAHAAIAGQPCRSVNNSGDSMIALVSAGSAHAACSELAEQIVLSPPRCRCMACAHGETYLCVPLARASTTEPELKT